MSLLHAITDALLGAIGEGDIGAHFPPTDPRWRGAASRVFLADAVRRVRALNGIVAHIDATHRLRSAADRSVSRSDASADRRDRRHRCRARRPQGDDVGRSRLHGPRRRRRLHRERDGAPAVERAKRGLRKRKSLAHSLQLVYKRAVEASRWGLNGRPRPKSGAAGLKSPASGVPAFERSGSSLSTGSKGSAWDASRTTKERLPMALYEHIYLARQDVTAPAGRSSDRTAQDRSSLRHGGSVTKVEPWGLKSLAFRIKKNRKAHFTLLNIDAPVGGDRRAGAPAQPQRRRHPLPHPARRRARGRPLGDAAQARRRRPRRARRPRPAATARPRRPPGSRRPS